MATKGEMFICRACGKESVKTGINQKFCSDCRFPQYKKQKAEYEQRTANDRKRTDKKNTSKEYICRVCGKIGVKKSHNQMHCADCREKISNKYDRVIGESFECENCGKMVIRNSGAQKYCSDCRKKVKNSYVFEYKLPEEPLMKKRAVSKPDFTIAEVCAAARKNNMTYGKYVAAWHNGLVDPPEIIKQKKRG